MLSWNLSSRCVKGEIFFKIITQLHNLEELHTAQEMKGGFELVRIFNILVFLSRNLSSRCVKGEIFFKIITQLHNLEELHTARMPFKK